MGRMRALIGMFLFAVLFTGYALVADAQGPGDRPTGREFAGAVNLSKEDTSMKGSLFVPEAVKQIRGIVVVMHQGLMSEDFYFNSGLRRVAAEAGCAVLLATVSRMQIEAKPGGEIASSVSRNATAGGGSALLQLLRRFAEETGRRELGDAPMLFWGFSAAASFGTTFAALHPDRTIGFVRYHTHRRELPVNLGRIKGIPALLLAGGKDETAGVEDAEQLWKDGRGLGAPWTFAVEPQAPHSSQAIQQITAGNLTVPWIAAVLRQRLSASRSLTPTTDAQAWLADVSTFNVAPFDAFVGDKRTASWLPDERVAQGWRTVVRSAN